MYSVIYEDIDSDHSAFYLNSVPLLPPPLQNSYLVSNSDHDDTMVRYIIFRMNLMVMVFLIFDLCRLLRRLSCMVLLTTAYMYLHPFRILILFLIQTMAQWYIT